MDMNGVGVLCKDMTEDQYHEMGKSLIEAGYEGEYPTGKHFNLRDQFYDFVFGVRNDHNYHYTREEFNKIVSYEEFMVLLKGESMHILDKLIALQKELQSKQDEYDALEKEFKKMYPNVEVSRSIKLSVIEVNEDLAVIPPDEWKKGDIVRVIDDRSTYYLTKGKEYTLLDIVDNDCDVYVEKDDNGDEGTDIPAKYCMLVKRA